MLANIHKRSLLFTSDFCIDRLVIETASLQLIFALRSLLVRSYRARFDRLKVEVSLDAHLGDSYEDLRGRALDLWALRVNGRAR